jgi:hypothetical protein
MTNPAFAFEGETGSTYLIHSLNQDDSRPSVPVSAWVIRREAVGTPGADPGNSERGGQDSFGKNSKYTGNWKIYEI